MKQVHIDCAEFTSRDAFHNSIARELSLPKWYGRNLDALHDCLAAVSEPTHLILENWQAAEENLERYASLIRTVLLHAEEENIHFRISFQ